jgi:23S rRNA (cytidine1920-2'-O)/16S rRNA (cytidine1409-2'-O)-methyltransferase
MERRNARTLAPGVLPEPVDLAVVDVSFISLRLVLDPIRSVLRDGRGPIVVLVKPQFEAGRAETPKGVVRDTEVQRRVVRAIVDAALAWGGAASGVVDSGLPGPKGNREFVLHLVQRQEPRLPDDIDSLIAAAVG